GDDAGAQIERAERRTALTFEQRDQAGEPGLLLRPPHRLAEEVHRDEGGRPRERQRVRLHAEDRRRRDQEEPEGPTSDGVRLEPRAGEGPRDEQACRRLGPLLAIRKERIGVARQRDRLPGLGERPRPRRASGEGVEDLDDLALGRGPKGGGRTASVYGL